MLLSSRSDTVLKPSASAEVEANLAAETMFPKAKSATSFKSWVALYSSGSPLGCPSSVGRGSRSSEGPPTMGPLGPSPLEEQPSNAIKNRIDKFLMVLMVLYSMWIGAFFPFQGMGDSHFQAPEFCQALEPTDKGITRILFPLSFKVVQKSVIGPHRQGCFSLLHQAQKPFHDSLHGIVAPQVLGFPKIPRAFPYNIPQMQEMDPITEGIDHAQQVVTGAGTQGTGAIAQTIGRGGHCLEYQFQI